MSKHRLEFKLIQMTPLMHFQSEQKGAGLRASDVKPRLDRYLKYEIGEEVLKPFTKSNKSKSLDYSMVIVSKNEKELNNKIFQLEKGGKIPADKCLLSDMGKKADECNIKVSYYNDITLLINSSHKKLLEYISVNIREFFVLNNFGTRSSKGYGCFYIQDDIDTIDKNVQVHYKYYCKFHGKEDDKIFFEIDKLWKSIKQPSDRNGINIDRYGELKRFNSIKSIQRSKCKYKSNLDYKDILGISIREEWIAKEKKDVKVLSKEFISKNRSIKIERYKSPVQFKIIKKCNDTYIYFDCFISNNSPVFEAECKFAFGGETMKAIRLPSSEEFKFDDFMNFIMKKKSMFKKVEERN